MRTPARRTSCAAVVESSPSTRWKMECDLHATGGSPEGGITASSFDDYDWLKLFAAVNDNNLRLRFHHQYFL